MAALFAVDTQLNLEIATNNLANVIVNGPRLPNGLLAVDLVVLDNKPDLEFSFKLLSMAG